VPYTTFLFDLDHTLFDSDLSEAAAFDITMRAAGVAVPNDHVEAYRRINGALWSGVERGEVRPIDLRTLRFQRLFAELGLTADVEEMAALFVHSLGANGELYPGAAELLSDLAGRGRPALVTNGLSDVQRARLSRTGIESAFDAVVISSEVGATKPGGEIFDLTFELLGQPDRASAVMIGDSLTSDIRGGSDYGIATCWYNPHGLAAGPDDVVTHESRSLCGIPTILSS
jgi:YjjG family noncanonical pyrimidine nucleotidase